MSITTAGCGFVAADAVRPQPYGWGTIAFLCDAEHGNARELSMARVTLKRGARNSLHVHPNCDELLYLLSGSLRHRVGDESVTMHAGDTVCIARGVPHQAEVLGDGDADMIVVYSTATREMVVLEDGAP